MLLLQRGHATEDALCRFSDIIPFALFPLAVAGLVLAYMQLGTRGPAWLTLYAAILAVKLVLVLALFLLGAWNRWQLTSGVLSGGGIVRRRVALSVRAEIALVLVILGLVAG
jgi:copper transport protein